MPEPDDLAPVAREARGAGAEPKAAADLYFADVCCCGFFLSMKLQWLWLIQEMQQPVFVKAKDCMYLMVTEVRV